MLQFSGGIVFNISNFIVITKDSTLIDGQWILSKTGDFLGFQFVLVKEDFSFIRTAD